MKKKIYCTDCKYDVLCSDLCNAPENTEKKVDVYLKIETVYKKKCFELNKDNNCKYYKKYKLIPKKSKWLKFWVT